MNPDVIRPLLRIKTLRADRADDEHRQKRAQYNVALAAVDAAAQALKDWREETPRRQAAIYDEIIGHMVGVDVLEGVKERVLQLREHETLLQQRLLDSQQAAKVASQAADEAAQAAAQARRDVSKFEEIVSTLQRANQAEAERREDLELEEFARAAPSDADDGNGDAYEWGDAA